MHIIFYVLLAVVAIVSCIGLIKNTKKSFANAKAMPKTPKSKPGFAIKRVHPSSWLDKIFIRVTYKSFGWKFEDYDDVYETVVTQKGNTSDVKRRYYYFSRRKNYSLNPIFKIAELIARFTIFARRIMFGIVFLLLIPFALYKLDFLTVSESVVWLTNAIKIYFVCIAVNIVMMILGKILRSIGAGKGKEADEHERMSIDNAVLNAEVKTSVQADIQREIAGEQAKVVKANYEYKQAKEAEKKHNAKVESAVKSYNDAVNSAAKNLENALDYVADSNLTQEKREKLVEEALGTTERKVIEANEIRESSDFKEMEEKGEIKIEDR